MNPKRLLSAEEVIEFFSANNEYKIRIINDHHLEINLVDESILLHRYYIDVQKLIETIESLQQGIFVKILKRND